MQFPKNTAIKVLSGNKSSHGGDYTWDLPKRKGGKWIPGEWTQSITPIICHRGYHLTHRPECWWEIDNPVAYLTQYRGRKTATQGTKFAVASCRLLRPLTVSELKSFHIYTSGSHKISGVVGRVLVGGKARVEAHDCTSVYADDYAEVVITGGTHCEAKGHAEIHAFGNTTVDVCEEAYVLAEGNSSVLASGNSRVEASMTARVVGSESTKILAHGDSVVQVDEGQVIVEAYENAYVLDTSKGANKTRIHAGESAVVRCEGSPRILTLSQSAVAVVSKRGKDILVKKGESRWVYQGSFTWGKK